MADVLAGYKTYIGLAIAIIAWISGKMGWHVDAAGLANDIATGLGLAISVYGRIAIGQRLAAATAAKP